MSLLALISSWAVYVVTRVTHVAWNSKQFQHLIVLRQVSYQFYHHHHQDGISFWLVLKELLTFLRPILLVRTPGCLCSGSSPVVIWAGGYIAITGPLHKLNKCTWKKPFDQAYFYSYTCRAGCCWHSCRNSQNIYVLQVLSLWYIR